MIRLLALFQTGSGITISSRGEGSLWPRLILAILKLSMVSRGAGRYGKLVVLVYIELAKNIGGASIY